HRIDGLLQFQDFAFDVDGDFLGEIACGDGGRHFGDIAHLPRQVRGHEIDVVGQILPGSGDAGHLCLPAEAAFRADLARDAGHFTGKAVELIDHRIDGVLELEDFAFHVDGDFARKVAAGDRGGDLGDVANLRCQVGGQEVDVVGQVL